MKYYLVKTRYAFYSEGELYKVEEDFEKGTGKHTVPKLYLKGDATRVARMRKKVRKEPNGSVFLRVSAVIVPVTLIDGQPEEV